MSSPAQILANRENSLHSTGPVTVAGKAAAAQNSLRHGLTSKSIVIPGEDPAEYEEHRAALIRDLRPANAIEAELVDELAANSWRLKRAHRIETAILTKIATDSPDPSEAIAQSFLERPKELDRLIRYMTAIERAYWRVFNKLEALQKARIANDRDQAMTKPASKTLPVKNKRRLASFRNPLPFRHQRPNQLVGQSRSADNLALNL